MIKIMKEYENLPKEIYVLFMANVINRFGDFVAIFLTLYLTTKLNLSYQVASIIVMIATLSAVPGALIGGKISDHWGSKKTYIILQTMGGFLLVPCAFLNHSLIIVGFIILSTFFNGAVRPVLQALATDVIPEDKRKTGFSLMYLGINLGVAIGPLLAGYLFKTNLPLFFLIDTATSLMAVSLVAFMIRTKTIKHMIMTQTCIQKGSINIWKEHRQLFVFIVIVSCFSLVYAQTSFSLPLLFDMLFKEESATRIGIIYSINAITVIIATTWVTSLTKNNHSVKNIVLAGLFYAVGFGAYAFLTGFASLALITVVWTIGELLHATNANVFIADQTPINYRGRVNSINISLKKLMTSLGILMGGWLIPIVGVQKVWLIIMFLTFGITGLLIFTMREVILGKVQKESSQVQMD